MRIQKKYSQNDEDIYIREYFKNKQATLLDIGGYDPFVFSNSRCLIENGWFATIVEPAKKQFEKFVKQYEGNPKINLINKAVSVKNGIAKFYECEDAVSTLSETHKEIWENNVKYKEIEIETISMDSLLAEVGQVTFLNLDVEGVNYNLFCLIPDTYLQGLEMLCIEHDIFSVSIKDRMFNLGFKLIYENPENLIFCK